MKIALSELYKIPVGRLLLYGINENNEAFLFNASNNTVKSDTYATININNGMAVFYEIIERDLPNWCLTGAKNCIRDISNHSYIAANVLVNDFILVRLLRADNSLIFESEAPSNSTIDEIIKELVKLNRLILPPKLVC